MTQTVCCTECSVPSACRSGRGKCPVERGANKYDYALKRFRDAYNTITGAEAKGLAQGRAEGIEDNKRDNAMRMKADGMPVELIAKYTGLSIDVINSL